MRSDAIDAVTWGGTAPRREPGPLRGTLALALSAMLVLGPSLGQAAEPPGVPASFAEVAAGALAASFVIRAAVAAGADSLFVQEAADPADVDEDGWEPVDPLSALRNRTLGAGVVIDAWGLALTSTRVLLRARDFEVVMMDGTQVTATVIGLDLPSDVAVLRLKGHGTALPHLPLGDSDHARAGDWVLSVGAPLGLDGTVVAGVITAVPGAIGAGPLSSYIQTDATMARGSAGGPLVDMNGQLLGIGTRAGGEGIAYAIPAKTLRRLVREIVETGRVSRPWLGVTSQSLNAKLARALGAGEPRGALIADVVPNGPAATAGVRPGDIVVAVGTTPTASRLEFERVLNALVAGDAVTLEITRAGQARTVVATVGEDPEHLPLAPQGALAKRRLGIEVRPISPTAGAVARDIDRWSSAARAGIRPGDVIREIDGRPIETPADFEAAARAIRPGTPVLMRVQRGAVVLYMVIAAEP